MLPIVTLLAPRPLDRDSRLPFMLLHLATLTTENSQGWYAIRREHKVMMGIFLFIGFLFIFGWSIMFYSIVYRWWAYSLPPASESVLTEVS